MDNFLFVLGSNFRLSLAELDNVLKYSSQFKGRIKDYSGNIAVVEFDNLHKDKYYIDRLIELQFLLGGCQKIAKIFDFIHIRDILDAFPLDMTHFKIVEKVRKKISLILNKVLVQIFPNLKNQSIFFAVSIYPNLFDEEYYSKVLVKHLLPFLNKEIMIILKENGVQKSLYYEYPEKNINSGNLNPIFPHHLIKYDLFKENRAEIIFGFTEEGVYIARTFTADDPSFKKRIDEERPFKEFKSSISPKLSIMMLNFLNLFEQREEKRILDPFVGNGNVILFALIQDFQIYGADFDQKKVNNTKRNINWLLKEVLEEPMPYLLDKRIKNIDIENLSDSFENEFFDGVCTEPPLGPFYKEKPFYIQAKELIDNELFPLYEAIFKEINKVLKPKGRICITAPMISTIDGGDLQLDVTNIALSHNFRQLHMIDSERIINKSNIKLQFQKQHVRNIIDAKKGQILKRKIFVFEKKS